MSELNVVTEESLLMRLYDKQKVNKELIENYMDKLASSALTEFDGYSENIAYDYLNNIKSCLNRVDVNISIIDKLGTELHDKKVSKTKYREDFASSMQEITQNDYFIDKLLCNLMDYSKIEFSIQNSENVTKETTIEKNDSQDTSYTPQLDHEGLEENLLYISETKKKVILPYTFEQLDKIINESNKYKSYEAVIKKFYTLPISYYKHTFISRFKEAFALVKNRSHGSTSQAFSLGVELFFKLELHPAIITACKDIDELDIYLSYLEDNEVENFKCFKIQYEALPYKVKKQPHHY